jgi:hypothetical protein
MRRRKKRISPFKIVLLVLVTIITINIGARYIISESNYEHNLESTDTLSIGVFDNQGYLNSATILTNFKYSLNQKPENYSIVVATYNALNYLKRGGFYNGIVDKTILPEIIKYYDLYAQLGFGHLGINPLAVSWYFKTLGLKAEVAYDRENIVERMSSNDICVLFRTDFKMHEFRALSYTTGPNAKFYGPNQSFHIANRINLEYKDLFLALITVSV